MGGGGGGGVCMVAVHDLQTSIHQKRFIEMFGNLLSSPANKCKMVSGTWIQMDNLKAGQMMLVMVETLKDLF